MVSWYVPGSLPTEFTDCLYVSPSSDHCLPAFLNHVVHPVDLVYHPSFVHIRVTPRNMTIVTTEDSKKKYRLKPLSKSDQECASAKAQATEKKVKLNAAIKVAIEVIDKIIEDLADEHEITFDHASTMVHLRG
jgi:hypothetical protein